MTLNTETESGSQGNAGSDVEAKGNTLDSIVGQAIAEMEAKDGTTPVADKATDEKTISKESDGKADIPDEVASKKAEDTESADKADIPSAPENWPKDRKTIFDTLPPDAKKAWLEHAKDYERGLTKQGDKFAEQRKNWEAVDSTLKEFEPVLAQNGMTKTQLVGNLVETYKNAYKNPVQFVKDAMQQFGIKPEQLVSPTPKEQDTYLDPAVKKLQDELNEQKQYTDVVKTTLEKQKAQELVQQKMQDLLEFAQSKDDSGNPVYPHFNEEFSGLMHEVVEATPALKQLATSDPKQAFHLAYQLAVAKNQAKFAQDEANKRDEEKAKAAKTIKPGLGSGGNVTKGKQTLDEIIANSLNQYGL